MVLGTCAADVLARDSAEWRDARALVARGLDAACCNRGELQARGRQRGAARPGAHRADLGGDRDEGAHRRRRHSEKRGGAAADLNEYLRRRGLARTTGQANSRSSSPSSATTSCVRDPDRASCPRRSRRTPRPTTTTTRRHGRRAVHRGMCAVLQCASKRAGVPRSCAARAGRSRIFRAMRLHRVPRERHRRALATLRRSPAT